MNGVLTAHQNQLDHVASNFKCDLIPYGKLKKVNETEMTSEIK